MRFNKQRAKLMWALMFVMVLSAVGLVISSANEWTLGAGMSAGVMMSSILMICVLALIEIMSW